MFQYVSAMWLRIVLKGVNAECHRILCILKEKHALCVIPASK